MYPEIIYQLALAQVPNIGAVHAKKLCDTFGSASEIFNTSQKDLEKIEFIETIQKTLRIFRAGEKQTLYRIFFNEP